LTRVRYKPTSHVQTARTMVQKTCPKCNKQLYIKLWSPAAEYHSVIADIMTRLSEHNYELYCPNCDEYHDNM
jgi:predicted RNA-binding Zn-ribbon protein involved in translation (DUF1610 family)